MYTLYTVFNGKYIYKKYFFHLRREPGKMDGHGCYARKCDFGVYRVYKVYKVVDLQGFAGQIECTRQCAKIRMNVQKGEKHGKK